MAVYCGDEQKNKKPICIKPKKKLTAPKSYLVWFAFLRL